MARETVDAAIVDQFKTYLKDKNKDFDELTEDEMKTESLNFLKDTYPGAKEPPNQIVELMASPSASKTLANLEMVNPEEKKICNGVSDTEDDTEDTEFECPKGWFVNALGDCILYNSELRSYTDAVKFCSDADAQLLELPH